MKLIEAINRKYIPCPTKVHELLKIALTDLEAAEQNEDYAINMNQWHDAPATEFFNGEDVQVAPCQVCQAGAVMAFTLQVPLDETIGNFDSFSYEWIKALYALNWFRCNEIQGANSEFPGFGHLKNKPNEPYYRYHENKDKYKAWAWAMQKAYEAEDL